MTSSLDSASNSKIASCFDMGSGFDVRADAVLVSDLMTTSNDPFARFKEAQRQGWGLFAPIATYTTMPAAELVRYADIRRDERVLDVACGTGVVSVTAARLGAQVSALDLSPKLIEAGAENAALAGVEIEFREGDVENLPYRDGAFDTVVSQFGHMFAPRPEIAIREMFRVLKPGGRIAFSTWPPDQFIGEMFQLTARHVPPPPGAAEPWSWGDPKVIRERLAPHARDLHFRTGVMAFPALSPRHYREFMEPTLGPVAKLVEAAKEDPTRLKKFRDELDALSSRYLDGNCVRQEFLMTRALKS